MAGKSGSRVRARKLRLELLECREMLAVEVTNTADSGSGSLRAALAQVDFTGIKDEVVFASSLFTSGAPVITLVNPISINEPVHLHSPHGLVIIQKASGSSAEQAFFLRPSLGQGIGEDFEIHDLVIQDFKYGIRVDHGGGVVNGTVEGVDIAGNSFQNNERGIFLERPTYPFEIRNNYIIGISTASSNFRAGIWMDTTGSFVNTFSPVIDNNIIVGNEDYGIAAITANIPNLTLTANRIGADHEGLAFPNGIGIYLSGGDLQNAVINTNNEVLANATGILLSGVNGVEISGNTISYNASQGIHFVASSNNEINGNTFAENVAAAIAIGSDLADTVSTRNRVSMNTFVHNGGLPIDLGNNGLFEPNDSGDLDGGPNALQNHPEIVQALVIDEGTHWRVPVRLDVRANGNYRLEFYRHNPDPNIKSYGFIRQETVAITTAPSGYDFQGDFFFQQGVELTTGERLAVLVIREESPGPSLRNDTSEILVASSPFVDNVAGPPKIEDVRLKGVKSDGITNTTTPWTRPAYSFKELSADGKQLDSLFTAGVNEIEIEFNEPVVIAANALTLIPSVGATITPQYQGMNGSVATWTIPGGIQADKYTLRLSSNGVTDTDGRRLDGEWDNPVAATDVLADPDGVGGPLTAVDDVGYDWNNDRIRTFAPGNGVLGGDFRLHFAYLPGDYNQDGIVLNTGPVSDLQTVKDGNGVSGPAADDEAVVNNVVSIGKTRLTAGRFLGDYNDNEVVENVGDFGDYNIWKMTFGSTTDLRADGNGNGVVDAADYTVWRDHVGAVSAWSEIFGVGGGGAGGELPVFDPLNLPRVANVSISGSNSTHAPFSFNGPDDNTDFDGSGIQLRTVPVGGADTITIRFTEDVNISPDMLKLTGLRSANRPTIAEFTYDIGTMTATWQFTGWTDADHYLISLSDAVTDVEGNSLDGEWVNPSQFTTVNTAVSEFPSGDGYAGGDFNFVMTLLPGDADLDLTLVNDLSIVASYYNLNGAQFTQGDFDGDGVVGSADVNIWANNWLASIDLQQLSLLGDLNGDWQVDDLDAQILYDNRILANPTPADGDLDGDGDIDINDLDIAFAQYGMEIAVVS